MAEDEHGEILDKISAVSTDTQLIIKEIETLNKMSNENYRTLRGTNGNDGLVSKVTGLQEDVSCLTKEVQDMNALLRGDGKDDPGLTGKVRELLKFKEQWGRYAAIVLGAIVLDLLARVLPHIYSVLAAGIN